MSNKDDELFEQARRRVQAKIKGRCIRNKDVIIEQEKEIEYYREKIRRLTDNEKEIFKKATCLKQDEKDFVLLFLKTLGRSDVENQTKEIQNFVKRFTDIKGTCDVEHKKYGTLSLKLSIIAGLFFAILLI